MKKFGLTVFVALVSGCSTMPGLEIIESDYAECESTQDCSVWSGRQLENLVRRAFIQGFVQGQQSARPGGI